MKEPECDMVLKYMFLVYDLMDELVLWPPVNYISVQIKRTAYYKTALVWLPINYAMLGSCTIWAGAPVSTTCRDIL